MNWIRARIAASPKAALVVGKAVFLIGSLLVVAALFARVEMIGINEVRAKGNLPAVQKLAEVHPQYPTWLVPEGPLGFIVAAAFVLVGMFVTVRASEAIKRGPGSRGG